MSDRPPKSLSGLRPETLLSSLLVVLAVNLLQRSIGFGRAVLLCRWLDPEQLGYWEMAYGFLMIASPLAVLGLPGSFARYLEKYRQRGQLRLFLRRTTLWTGLLAAGVMGLMLWRVEDVATLMFGDASHTRLTQGVLACLAVVISHHFLEAVFAGLRMYRVVSAMHFTQSMAFAGFALALVAWWRPSVESVVIGYAAACALSIAGVLLWSAPRVVGGESAAAAVAHREFWPPLVRFALWVWVTNLLTNVFSVIDRYMIVHCGGFAPDEALAQVGNYHSGNIVPLLVISVANLLVGAMTPHLSHEWESGHRDRVAKRINLGLKLGAVGMTVAGVAVLWLGPLMFRYAFESKFDGGLAVMPWALLASVWFGLLLIAQTYLWCAEKSHLAAPPLALGLGTNVLLNLLLLPPYGLLGAVAATAASTLLTLLATLLVNRRIGMRLPGALPLLMLAPAVLVCGAPAATVAALLLAVVSATSGAVFDAEERAALIETLLQRLARFGLGRRPAEGAAP